MRIVELEGAYNVRDIGGVPAADGRRIRPGLLYRGGSLDAITASDQDLLFVQLRIGAVIDVRARREIGPASWRDAFANYHQLPVISDELIGTSPMPQNDPHALADVYLNDLERAAPIAARIVDLTAGYTGQRIPCIIHCAAGRDRTGLLAAVLLMVLDVQDAVIAHDYVLSNQDASHVERGLAANPLYLNGRLPGHELAPCHAATMTAFLTRLRARHGSAARFLLSAGLDPAVLRRLAAALSE